VNLHPVPIPNFERYVKTSRPKIPQIFDACSEFLSIREPETSTSAVDLDFRSLTPNATSGRLADRAR
jgi:hypothetical protein